MGWTFSHKDSFTTPREYLEKQLTWSSLPESARPQVVAHTANGSTHAFAVRYPREYFDATGSEPWAEFQPSLDGAITTAIVFLTRIDRGEAYNFGYKDMSETSGPYEPIKSAGFLALLSPVNLDNQSGRWAHEWRERCRAAMGANKRRKAITEGARVTLPEPVRFTDGRSLSEFTATFVQRGRTRRRTLAFRAPDGGLYSIHPTHLENATIH